jgi:hypothetical protein
MMQEGEVLKRDVLGRVRTPKEKREALLDEFERSGLSGKEFAKLVGVKYQTFAGWAQQRRERKQHPRASEAVVAPQFRWLEAVAEKPECPDRSALMVHLPGGARMEIMDITQAGLAAAVIRSLENKPKLPC